MLLVVDSYYYGLGDTIKNYTAAFQAYDKAANNDSPYAMCALANMILKNEGGKPAIKSSPGFNVILAKKWFTRAIKQHRYPEAQYCYAKLLLQSREKNNIEEGVIQMNEAAKQGHIEALVISGRYDRKENRIDEAMDKFRTGEVTLKNNPIYFKDQK